MYVIWKNTTHKIRWSLSTDRKLNFQRIQNRTRYGYKAINDVRIYVSTRFQWKRTHTVCTLDVMRVVRKHIRWSNEHTWNLIHIIRQYANQYGSEYERMKNVVEFVSIERRNFFNTKRNQHVKPPNSTLLYTDKFADALHSKLITILIIHRKILPRYPIGNIGCTWYIVSQPIYVKLQMYFVFKTLIMQMSNESMVRAMRRTLVDRPEYSV